MPDSQPHANALVQHVRQMIRIQDMNSMAGSLGKLVIGGGVCLGMGIVVASLITLCLYSLFATTLIGWWGWLFLYLLVLVPLLIWHERRSRGDYIADALLLGDSTPSSRTQHELNRAGLQVAAYAAMLAWGPRALIDGIHALRGQRSMSQHVVFDRAALLVADLSQKDGGILIKQLLHAPEDMQVFGSAVDLLDTHGWIGKSTDGKSLWLSSTFRQKLRSSLGGQKL